VVRAIDLTGPFSVVASLGGNAEFAVAMDYARGGTENLQYQWQAFTPAGGWTDVENGTEPVLSLSDVDETTPDRYRVVVSDGECFRTSETALLFLGAEMRIKIREASDLFCFPCIALETTSPANGFSDAQLEFSKDLENWEESILSPYIRNGVVGFEFSRPTTAEEFYRIRMSD